MVVLLLSLGGVQEKPVVFVCVFLYFLPFQTTYCLTELAVLMRKQVREKLVNHLHTDCNISVSDLETR